MQNPWVLVKQSATSSLLPYASIPSLDCDVSGKGLDLYGQTLD